MKKTVKTGTAVMAVRILANAKIDKMEDNEKFQLIRALRPLKKAAADYDALLEEATTRLRPSDYDALLAKEQAGEKYTPEEEARVRKFNADVAGCMRTEEERDVELDFEPLDEEALVRFGSSNPDLPLGTLSELMDLLCTHQ